MVDASFDRVELRDVVIVGGGCYGTFYAGQLIRARERDRAAYHRLLIVDRDPGCRFAREIGPAADRELVTEDWNRFFDRYLSHAGPPSKAPDAIVPSPFMPHLMYHWLIRRASARWPGRTIESRPVPIGPGTPYDVLAPDGTRYVSYADWLCPTHCIEPTTCPITRAPRTWEMAEALSHMVSRLDAEQPTAGPVVFVCRHRVFGVGMFDVSEVITGDAQVAEAGKACGAVDILVGTVSSCHGAISLLHLGAGSRESLDHRPKTNDESLTMNPPEPRSVLYLTQSDEGT
jgi:hypothetical protein